MSSSQNSQRNTGGNGPSGKKNNVSGQRKTSQSHTQPRKHDSLKGSTNSGYNRRKRHALGKAARQAGRPDSESAKNDQNIVFPRGSGSTLDIVQPTNGGGVDRPRRILIESCPSRGQSHVFDRGNYCVKCHEYASRGLGDGPGPVDNDEVGSGTDDGSDGESLNPFVERASGQNLREQPLHNVRKQHRSSNNHRCKTRMERHSRLSQDGSHVSLEGSTGQRNSLLSHRERKRRRKERYANRTPESTAMYIQRCKDKGTEKRLLRAKKNNEDLDLPYPVFKNVQEGEIYYSRRISERKWHEPTQTTWDLVQTTFEEDCTQSNTPNTAVDLSCRHSEYSERRRWYTSAIELLGYRRDHFDYGSFGVSIRNMKKSEAHGQDNVSEEDFLNRVRYDLYVYLVREKLPRSEYTKAGKYDVNLAHLHMQKLTKQFFSLDGKKRDNSFEGMQLEIDTQAHAASERTKDFLLGETGVSQKKYSGFLGACLKWRRYLQAGLLALVLVATLFALWKWTPYAVKACLSNRWIHSKLLKLAAASNPISAMLLECFVFLKHLFKDALNPTA